MTTKRTEVDGLGPEDIEALIARAVLAGSGVVQDAVRELSRALRAQSGVLDKQALAEHLGIRPRTVEKWVREGGLPCRRVGRTPLFMADEVEDWVRRHPVVVAEACQTPE